MGILLAEDKKGGYNKKMTTLTSQDDCKVEFHYIFHAG